MEFHPEHNMEEEEVFDPRIEHVTSFDDLYDILMKIAVIPGSYKNYSANELRAKIEEVRTGERDISFITRTFGLRRKVKELLKNDPVYQAHLQEQEQK